MTDVAPGHASLPGRLRSGLRRLVGWLVERGRRKLAPFAEGFAEHGWSGKLFLLTGAASMAGTLATFVMGLLGSALSGPTLVAIPVVLTIGAVVFGVVIVPLLLVQRRFLLGIARFEKWARILALVITGTAVVHGVSSLVFGVIAGRMGGRGLILAIAETALSAQFFHYFLRTEDRHVIFRRDADAPANELAGADEQPKLAE